MNPAFKHLESKLKIGDLTIRQWGGIIAGIVVAAMYANFLHPFSTKFTMVTAFYMAAIPIAVAVVGGRSEFDAWLVLRSAVRWRGAQDRYLPGAGRPTPGYRVVDESAHALSTDESLRRLDHAALWGETR